MAISRVESLGYRCIGHLDIRSYLPHGKRLRATLCVSDTHLLPTRAAYGNDVPRELLRLVEALPDYQLFVLGDFLEALMLSDKQIASLPTSGRLRSLLEAIRFNAGLKIVPGNHDHGAISFFKRYFGQNTYVGGFRIGRLVFCHGHELGLDATHMAERVPFSVAVGGTLDRLGVGIPWGTVTNEAVGAYFQGQGLYPIFGHTHTPTVNSGYANTGCFLDGYRSFTTIEGHSLYLWESVE